MFVNKTFALIILYISKEFSVIINIKTNNDCAKCTYNILLQQCINDFKHRSIMKEGK
jgi:hypothetical protein